MTYIQDLEDDHLNTSTLLQKEEEKFHVTKSAIAATCDQLQTSCARYQQELQALKGKMNRIQEEVALFKC